MSMGDAFKKAGYKGGGNPQRQQQGRGGDRGQSGQAMNLPRLIFRDENGYRKKELFTEHAVVYADAMLRMTQTQLRKYYNEVKALEARIKANPDFKANEALIGLIKSKVAYGMAKETDNYKKEAFADFWNMFDILTANLKLKNTEVIFDITHCFRAIPLFTAIYIRLLKHIEPSAIFSHIFYGILEKGQTITPIVDLVPTVELFDWIDATTSFIKYGELEDLSIKMKIANDKIWKGDIKEKPKILGEFAKRLKELSDLSRLTYVPLLPQTSKEMSELLNREESRKEILDYVKPFSLLTDSLITYTTRFAKPSIWESHLEAAKWYLENKRPTQSLLVLRETILTSLCEKDGCDPFDLISREKREKELYEQRRTSKPLIKLWSKITEARNKAGHALMGRTAKDLSAAKAIRKVESLIE